VIASATTRMLRQLVSLTLLTLPLLAQESKPAYTAAELIAAVKAAKPKGDIQIRATLQQKGKSRLQVQIKHHTAANGDRLQMHQLLYPKERKGEGLVLRITDGGFSGWTFAPGSAARPLTSADRTHGVFGTDLLIEDLLADFLSWSSHAVVRQEKLGPISCSVIESKAPANHGGKVSLVRSWIDDRRMVPQKIEILDSAGNITRTILTERVHRSPTGYYVPTEFSIVSKTGAETKVTGSGVRDDLSFTDDDFTEAALTRGLGSAD
jgi:hypothetical protein